MITEADTCRLYVLPKLDEAGWNDEPHSFSEQKSFTDGCIVVTGNHVKRRPQKRADYLLRFTRDFMVAVVEAKAAYKTPAAGLQQAKDYAEILGLNFAYATNGKGIVEFDYTTGLETELNRFPTPQTYMLVMGCAPLMRCNLPLPLMQVARPFSPMTRTCAA